MSAILGRPGDRDGVAGEHQLSGLEQHFVLRGTDLGFDDLDG